MDEDDADAASRLAGGEVDWMPLRVAYDDEGNGLVPLLLLLVLNRGVLSFSMGLGRLGYCGGGSISNVCCREGDFLSLQ